MKLKLMTLALTLVAGSAMAETKTLLCQNVVSTNRSGVEFHHDDFNIELDEDKSKVHGLPFITDANFSGPIIKGQSTSKDEKSTREFELNRNNGVYVLKRFYNDNLLGTETAVCKIKPPTLF